jgi:hypothetical protein
MVALLAAVPKVHLISGKAVAESYGKVAFGTDKIETFLELDELIKGVPTKVFIYASNSDVKGRAPLVTWRAVYMGRVSAVSGLHPAGNTFRPPSTFADPETADGAWKLFWEVANLQELAATDCIPISTFTGFGNNQPFANTFKPRGPTLIEW